ncbi:oxidoreductase of aldo/keto reductase family, subgroup 1 [Lachnospiraceae bacterium TWA4]|nr:oxidoreductase of aldo/keto reductase family, subgroup 1 [Lachnospiraceae bacterium TWA4]
MIFEETYTMNNGLKIPKLGLGTWFIDDDKVAEAVRQAVKIGYRNFDTAQAYGNEAGVGEGIRTCKVSREELFVGSKVTAEHKSYEEAKKSIDETLEKMGLTYLDMMIIHSPQPWMEVNQSENRYFAENKEVWRALEDAVEAGKVRSIGISNFDVEDMKNILEDCRIKPAVNQFLTHISNTNFEVIDFCQKNDILVEAYSPVAHGEMLKNEAVADMAKKYGITVPQLCIRYTIQLDCVSLPKTANPDHMKSNAELDFVISDADMEVLKQVKKIENYGDASMFPVYGGKL